MRLPWNFPALAERDRVMVCKHLYESARDSSPQSETHWRKGSDSFKRDDGSATGRVVACLLCAGCRDSLDPKEVEYIEFLSLGGRLMLADALSANGWAAGTEPHPESSANP